MKPKRNYYPTTTAAEQALVNQALQECYGNDLRKFSLAAGVSESTVRRVSRYSGIPFKRETIERLTSVARAELAKSEPVLGDLLPKAEPASDLATRSADIGDIDLSEFGFNLGQELEKVVPDIGSNGTAPRRSITVSDVLAEADKLSPRPVRYVRLAHPRNLTPDTSHPTYEQAYAEARADLLAQLQEHPDIQQRLNQTLDALAQLEDGLSGLRRTYIDALTAQKPRLIMPPRLHISEDPHNRFGLPMECPVCSGKGLLFDYNHITGVRVAQGDDVTIVAGSGTRLQRSQNGARGSLVTIAFSCEEGHYFCLDFQFHKGQVFLWAEECAQPDWVGDSGELWRD